MRMPPGSALSGAVGVGEETVDVDDVLRAVGAVVPGRSCRTIELWVGAVDVAADPAEQAVSTVNRKTVARAWIDLPFMWL